MAQLAQLCNTFTLHILTAAGDGSARTAAAEQTRSMHTVLYLQHSACCTRKTVMVEE
jgi:hypothetical protein